MSRALILVRHAMPEVTPGVSPKLWALGDSAGEDCVLLAHALPGDLAPTVWTSSERKAEQTAGIIAMRRGLQVEMDDAFGEVDRPAEWVEDHRALAAAYLAGVEHPGWEPRAHVRRRFADAIDRAFAATPGDGDIVVVNHGMALSLYLELVARVDIVAFWQALTFPDAWRLEPATGELSRVYSGAPAPGA
jgi:broad specificity phosphatase PhoE